MLGGKGKLTKLVKRETQKSLVRHPNRRFFRPRRDSHVVLHEQDWQEEEQKLYDLNLSLRRKVSVRGAEHVPGDQLQLKFSLH